MLFGMVVFVVTAAALAGGSGERSRRAHHSGGPAKRGAAEAFSYSDLRDPTKDRKVRTATLKPAEFKAENVLTGGAKHAVG